MPHIDPENVEKFKKFCHFQLNFCTTSGKFNEVDVPNCSKTEQPAMQLDFLKRTLQRFASKTLQNDFNVYKNKHLVLNGLKKSMQIIL